MPPKTAPDAERRPAAKRKAQPGLSPPGKKTATGTTKITEDYATNFRAARKPEEIRSLFNQVVEEENGYREVFAQERDSTILNNPYLMLVDVHKEEDIFRITEDVYENLPHVFPHAVGCRKKVGEPCIVSKDEFRRNLKLFSEGQLKDLNWDNIFMAGGSTLACLQPIPEVHNINNQTKRKYYHDLAYCSSDIDLFIYGIEDQEVANKKVLEIYEAVVGVIHPPAIAFRSTHAITIISQYPYRHIQIVLRLYKSPAEVLMGFDVDACAVGYDGKNVWMTPRCHRALVQQENVVDMSRRSPSYEMRLAKYSERGFSVVVPSLDRTQIDPQLFERRFDQVQGLAKLLLLETLQDEEARNRYKELQRLLKCRPEGTKHQSFWAALDSRFTDIYSVERLRTGGGAEVSDYSTVFLPWGPKWTAEKIRKMMYTKDMILNSEWYDKNKTYHTHPCFFGHVSEVVNDCCGNCPPVKDAEIQEQLDNMYVQGPVRWITVNPGAQNTRIGSFHPITEGDWSEGACVSKTTDQICLSTCKKDLAGVKSCIDRGVDLNNKDSFGRTALHIAALVGATEIAKLLLEKGAMVSCRTSDGRTALHLAAQYDHPEVVRLIAEKIKAIVTVESKTKKKDKSRATEEMDEEREEDDDERGSYEGEDDDDGDDDEDQTFISIKEIVEQKKKKLIAQRDGLSAAEQEKKVTLDDTDWDYKFTSFHYAVYFDSVKSIEVLAEVGVDVSRPVHYIDESGSKVNTCSTLYLAMFNNHVNTFKTLLGLGASIDVLDMRLNNICHLAAGGLRLEFLKLLTKKQLKTQINSFNKDWQTPVMLAINNCTTREKEESEKFSDPCSQAHYDVVEFLVTNGAKLEFTPSDLPSESHMSKFPELRYSWQAQSASNVHLKLQYTVEQPIFVVLEVLSLRLLKFLIKKKVDVNRFSSNYNTPLDRLEISMKKRDMKDQLRYLKLVRKQIEKSTSPLHTFELELEKKRLLKSCEDRSTNKRCLDRQAYEMEKNKRLDRMKYMQEMRETLKAAGAITLLEVKLPSADIEGKRIKEMRKLQIQHEKKPDGDEEEFSFLIESLHEEIPNCSVSMSPTTFDRQELYQQLHTLFWTKGDIKLLDNLTTKPKVGKQVHVASRSHQTEYTPLHLAVIQCSLVHAVYALETVKKQWTPLPVPDPIESNKTRSLNNFDLAVMMDRIKPGKYLNKDGGSVKILDKLDPNVPRMQLNCTTSPASFIKSSDGRGNTVFHLAATNKDCLPVLRAIFEFITSNTNEELRYLSSADKPLDKDNKKFLIELLNMKNNKDFTAFDLAIVKGNVEIAKELLSHMADCDIPNEENQYKGLDVGGKKMDWAKEHHYREEDESLSSLVLAVFFDRPEAVKFLIEEAPKIWERTQQQSLKPSLLSKFSIQQRNKQGWGVYEACLQNPSVHALKMLISLDEEKYFQQACTTKERVTPLHLASMRGYTECVQVLVAAGVDLVPADNVLGWTPLHYAVAMDRIEVVRELLKVLDEKGVNHPSAKYRCTPLMMAVLYERLGSLGELLKSPKVDRDAQDVLGRTTIHLAITQGKVEIISQLLPNTRSNFTKETSLGLNSLDYANALLMQSSLLWKSGFTLTDMDNLSQLKIHKEIAGKSPATDRQLCDSTEASATAQFLLNLVTEEIKQKKLVSGQRGEPIQRDAEVETLDLNDIVSDLDYLSVSRGHFYRLVSFLNRRFTPPSEEMVLSSSSLSSSSEEVPSKPHRKKYQESESESESSCEKPRKGKGWTAAKGSTVPSKKKPMVKEDSSDDDDDDEEEEAKGRGKKATKTTKGKVMDKESSDEASDGYNEEKAEKEKEEEDEDEDEKPTTLEGMTFAFSGTLPMTRADVMKLIRDNGGKCATSVTNSVTHILVADPNSCTGKIQQAKDKGVKIVGMEFLAKLMD
eukprot:TRINITY_DN6887_c0_g3_i3.p1 TRINITY_DN6887_c0_g3~~TRINITY_DN6887_c0_g3_i3.p1  ORF type:complete len:1928 (-),score=499.26 TRINITY_DN6887_c0_g3_i3:166-5883(-)